MLTPGSPPSQGKGDSGSREACRGSPGVLAEPQSPVTVGPTQLTCTLGTKMPWELRRRAAQSPGPVATETRTLRTCTLGTHGGRREAGRPEGGESWCGACPQCLNTARLREAANASLGRRPDRALKEIQGCFPPFWLLVGVTELHLGMGCGEPEAGVLNPDDAVLRPGAHCRAGKTGWD